MKKVLEADGIQFAVKGRMLLSDVYIRCEQHTITGLLGRNGAGKSTLFEIIFGILGETKSVRIDSQPLPHAFKHPDRIRYLPQFHFIPGFLKIKRIFEDYQVSFNDFIQFFPGTSITPESRIGNLSGGERRLVEIFVIAHSHSAFALLDEPFSYLSPVHSEQVIGLLLHEKKRKGFIITDHLYNQVMDISEMIYVLSGGKTTPVKNTDDLRQWGYL